MKKHLFTIILTITSLLLSGQEEDPFANLTFPVQGIFKSYRVVTLQSVETPAQGELDFLIAHHFGQLNEGAYNLWGLDFATIRLGLEYGITPRLSVALGRSGWQKNIDGALKYQLLQQREGAKPFPLTVTFYTSANIYTVKRPDIEQTIQLKHRMSYTFELMIARKISPALSLQLTPSLTHLNTVSTTISTNDLWHLTGSGRVKITSRLTLNGEYSYKLAGSLQGGGNNILSAGFDIDTGGHIFQLFLTNAMPMYDTGILTYPAGSWSDGALFFGFNIHRAFQIIKPAQFSN